MDSSTYAGEVDLGSTLGETVAVSFPAGLRTGRFVIALEITPPRQVQPTVLLRRAALLGAHAEAVNVIQRPDRESSLAASLLLRSAGVHPVWHLVNRGRTRRDIGADLAAAAAGGIAQVLCLRGDHPGADGDDTPLIREVVARTRDALPDALIGATLNQNVPDRAAVLRTLRPKLAAGADYVQTQPVFDVAALRPYAEQLRALSPGTRIVAMAMPLLSANAARRIATRLGIAPPPTLLRRLESGGSAAGWQDFEETIAALVAAPWADGVAIMTYEMDPAAEVGQRIVAALQAVRAMRAEAGTERQ